MIEGELLAEQNTGLSGSGQLVNGPKAVRSGANEQVVRTGARARQLRRPLQMFPPCQID